MMNVNVTPFVTFHNSNYYKHQKLSISATRSLSSLPTISSHCSTSPVHKSSFRNQDFVLTSRDVHAFKRLLDEPVVRDFLDWDCCNMLADNYLLATALTYMKRANMAHQQYTPVYLFVALYLAHDMHEDELDLKNDLVRFAMCEGKHMQVSHQTMQLFLRKRTKLWHAIGMRTAVNKLCCEAIMSSCLPHHPIWRRERHEDHGGVALVSHVKSQMCHELHLRNSYVECHIRCIVCDARRFRQQKVALAASVNEQRQQMWSQGGHKEGTSLMYDQHCNLSSHSAYPEE